MNILFSLEILKSTKEHLQIRQKIAKRYISELKNTPHLEIEDFNPNHSYTQFIIKVDKNRDGFAKELQDRGVETKLHYIPLHLLSYYKNKYELRINSFPNSLNNYQQILSLPIHPYLSNEDVEYIIQTIQEVAKTRV